LHCPVFLAHLFVHLRHAENILRFFFGRGKSKQSFVTRQGGAVFAQPFARKRQELERATVFLVFGLGKQGNALIVLSQFIMRLGKNHAQLFLRSNLQRDLPEQLDNAAVILVAEFKDCKPGSGVLFNAVFFKILCICFFGPGLCPGPFKPFAGLDEVLPVGDIVEVIYIQAGFRAGAVMPLQELLRRSLHERAGGPVRGAFCQGGQSKTHDCASRGKDYYRTHFRPLDSIAPDSLLSDLNIPC
jgi:hypothetical protein